VITRITRCTCETGEQIHCQCSEAEDRNWQDAVVRHEAAKQSKAAEVLNMLRNGLPLEVRQFLHSVSKKTGCVVLFDLSEPPTIIEVDKDVYTSINDIEFHKIICGDEAYTVAATNMMYIGDKARDRLFIAHFEPVEDGDWR